MPTCGWQQKKWHYNSSKHLLCIVLIKKNGALSVKFVHDQGHGSCRKLLFQAPMFMEGIAD